MKVGQLVRWLGRDAMQHKARQRQRWQQRWRERKRRTKKDLKKINLPKNCQKFEILTHFHFWLDLLKLSVENLKWIWYRTRALVYFYTLLRYSASKQVASNWERKMCPDEKVSISGAKQQIIIANCKIVYGNNVIITKTRSCVSLPICVSWICIGRK